MTSLRTRGFQATWQRLLRQFKFGQPSYSGAALYLPQATGFSPFAVPCSDTPQASIIIPVYNQCAYTLECLRALAAHPARLLHEIIVVDDGSSDQTAEWMGQIEGLHYHRRASNGGFIAACNDGARLARGEYLVFLNNDTIPQPGWLEALMATLSMPGIGLVGAQLLYPDGRLQEAGGVVFSDGSAWNYGRFESPHDPRFSYLRDADYCSGAALAIPARLFEELGGFDTRYAPAYYEDTDLAFAVRESGHRVVYQPLAKVVHLEGITSGTDLNVGPKAYQRRNQSVFTDKWRHRLVGHAVPGSIPSSSSVHGRSVEILIIDALTPQPDRDSGSLRLVNLMSLLQQEDAHVVFVPADLKHCDTYTDALRSRGVEVWHAPFAKGLPAWFKAHGHRFQSVMVSRHYVASEISPLLHRHAAQAMRVFDTVDLHYLRESREAEVLASDHLRRTSARTRARELSVVHDYDLTLVVSRIEQELLARDAARARVEVLSNLHEPAGRGAPFEARQDLLFVGGFRHPPNVDAVTWFTNEVFPLIRAEIPGIRFHCIGADSDELIRHIGQIDGVHLHGHVPDLEPFLHDVRVAVAPLRYGAGVKGKVNLSMAHGQPVVATSIAVEGMHLESGKDVMAADSAESFAQATVRLYRDAELWERLSIRGQENIRLHFSKDAARETVRRVFFSAAPPRPS